MDKRVLGWLFVIGLVAINTTSAWGLDLDRDSQHIMATLGRDHGHVSHKVYRRPSEAKGMHVKLVRLPKKKVTKHV